MTAVVMLWLWTAGLTVAFEDRAVEPVARTHGVVVTSLPRRCPMQQGPGCGP